VIANPWGFANWFENQTPTVRLLIEALRKAAEPLPDPKDPKLKSFPLVALQLLKRWRNKCYDSRTGMRRPPSVLLSFFAANLPGRRSSLLEELNAQCQHLLNEFSKWDKAGKLIDVRNPACPEDKFSDRWPASMGEQRQFVQDLKGLSERLDELSRQPSIPDCNKILSELFGEKSTRLVLEGFAKRYENSAYGGKLQQYLRSGAIALAASGIGSVAKPGPIIAVPKSTNFGSD
jgi:hypothetical protein